MAIDRECRVIRHLVLETKTTEPPVAKVEFNLLAQSPIEADAVAVADDQHPDHELGVNRRTTDVAVERLELLAQIAKDPRHDRIDPSQKMAARNTPFEIEQIEQLALIARLPPHHAQPPPLTPPADGITVRR